MKVGDLVSHGVYLGIVMGRKRRYEPGKSPLVKVLVNGQVRLFEYCSLEVISESR